MNVELEKLIDLAVADGIITDKERLVVARKAKELGVDLDEFDVILEAKLYQRRQTLRAQAPANPPRTTTEGQTIKCPQCGASVPSLQSHCTACGHEFRGIGANTSWEQLSLRLAQTEEKFNESNAKAGVFSQQPPQRLWQAQAGIIESFPVPSTKESILEFLLAAASLAGTHRHASSFAYGPGRILAAAYHRLLQSCILKAEVMLANDTQSIDIIRDIKQRLHIR